jgi:malate dehydrogenase (oxaloacetate-decarboxylating)
MQCPALRVGNGGVATTGPGYSITLRVEVSDSSATAVVAAAIAAAGGTLTALDVVESHASTLVVDVTGDAVDADHATAITAAVDQMPGVTVRNVSDRTFLIHLGGKLSVTPTVSLKNGDDLSRAYTPGVARVCMAIAANFADARKLTVKCNTVAIVTDGSAVLGLGNIGPAAAMPVMEGEAALFNRFAGVDAWPVCLDTQDVEEIVRTVQIIAPTYGGINLEDISAPRCFEIERRLRDLLDIPVFHDDQHGTAIVVLTALTNALRVVGKRLGDVKIVVSGVGAAGNAIIRLLHRQGASDIVGCDRCGAVEPDDDSSNEFRRWIAQNTNPRRRTGTLREVLDGADVFIGVSAPNLLTGADIATMASGAIVFAVPNPDPEADPVAAGQTAAVVATGRSDYPNQINNVLAFPGFFRGMLDPGAHVITDECMLAAARAIAEATRAGDELNASYIVPSVFDPHVATAVAAAVRDAALYLSPKTIAASSGRRTPEATHGLVQWSESIRFALRLPKGRRHRDITPGVLTCDSQQISRPPRSSDRQPAKGHGERYN